MTNTADKQLSDLQAVNTRQTLTLAGLARRHVGEAIQTWGKETSKTFAAINSDIGRFEAQTKAQWAANRAPLSFALRRRMVVNGKERTAAMARLGTSSGQLMGMVGRIGGAAQSAADFEQGNQAIGRSAALTNAQLATMSGRLLQVARDSNQTAQDVQKAFGQMLAAGMRFDAVAGSIGAVSRAAKATYVDIQTMASLARSLQVSLGVAPRGLEQALGGIAVVSEKGRIGMAQMAALLPTLAPGFQRLGVSGAEGAASMAAALQVARGGAGSDQQAAGNTQAFLDDLVSPAVVKRASATLGLNLVEVMRQAQAAGGNPFDAAVAGILKATAGDLSKLDAVFQRNGASAFLRSMSADWAGYSQVRRQAAMQGEGAIDARLAEASQSLGFKLERLGNSFDRLKLAFGQAMGPAVGKVADSLSGLLDTATGLVEKNPQLVAGVTSAGVAFAAIGTVVNGAEVAFRLVEAPALRVMGFLQRWKGGETLLQMGRLGSATLRVGGALRWVAMGIGGLSAGPIAGIAIAIAVVAVAVAKLWNGIKETFNGIGAGIGDSIQPSLGLLSDTFAELEPAWDFLGGALSWIKGLFDDLFEPIELSADALSVFHGIGHVIGQALTWSMRLAIGMVTALVRQVVMLGRSFKILGMFASGDWSGGWAASKELSKDTLSWGAKLFTSLAPVNPASAVDASRKRRVEVEAEKDKAKAAARAEGERAASEQMLGMPMLGGLGADIDLAGLQGIAAPTFTGGTGRVIAAPTPTPMVNHWNITQLAGESAEALARRVIAMLEREQAVQQRSALTDGIYN